jgi:5-bromo-4-chloroindolyl phosphate hydrolysis protein
MKSVMYFVFKDSEENHIDDIQNQINHDVKQYIITDIVNPPKTIYSKIDNIFFFKDITSVFERHDAFIELSLKSSP